ncbi:Hypothetical protein, putative [Bodo saltans]|uniref:Uncharacterized protein n=1 Tax=Bodo saltans TaxID=75058 RepID=A0A0S4JQQ8_BODSA|nr:Hypothetical protein, putative [Bodo saltans]|eukprot:CUG93862.1 Hypothetical protein, putative [Bodo saltans]
MAPKRHAGVGATLHSDPNDDSQRRCCTPDPAEDSLGRSNRSGGGGGNVETTAATAAAANPIPHGTPQKDTTGAGGGASGTTTSTNARHLMVRYKSLIHDIVNALHNPVNLTYVDDFIALTEDALRGFKTTKMESRATLRRLQSNVLPLARRDEPPHEAGAQTPPPPALPSQNVLPLARRDEPPHEAGAQTPPPPALPSQPRMKREPRRRRHPHFPVRMMARRHQQLRLLRLHPLRDAATSPPSRIALRCHLPKQRAAHLLRMASNRT